jgi:hypothetical protein
MNLNNIEITDHFLQRIRQRNVPIELVKDCLRNGKKIKTDRNILIDNKLIICCLSLIDKAALTIKYSRHVKPGFERDARRYNTTPEHIAGIYFQSLGYKN